MAQKRSPMFSNSVTIYIYKVGLGLLKNRKYTPKEYNVALGQNIK